MPPALRQPLAWMYFGLICLAVTLVGATTISAIRASTQLERSVAEVARSQDVLRLFAGIHAALADAEAYLRGYVISAHDPWFVQRADAAEERIHRLADELDAVTRGDRVREPQVDELAMRIDARLRFAREGMQMIAEGKLDGELMVERIKEASELSEAVRELTTGISETEYALLRERQEQMATTLAETRSIVLIANSLAMVAGLLGLVLLRRAQNSWRTGQLAAMEAEQARAASASKSAFLASMSHEIRTPMNAIFGFSQLLAGRLQGREEAQYVRSIMTSGRALMSLINDILDLSKIEAGKMQITVAPTDLRGLIDETLAMFATMAAEKRLSLRADVAVRVPVAIEVDAARLRQVLINLVGNAIKYTDDGGVLLRVDSSDGDAPGTVALEIAVEDTGMGIPPSQLESIFEPFVQGQGADGREGSGLGLAIVRRVVELTGGAVDVNSRIGKGSTFRLRWPRVRTAAAADAPSVELVVDFDALAPARVLVVDDVAWNRELLQAMLRDTRHEVALAANGLEAISAARRAKPDVILLDMRMPVMDGRQTHDALRADPNLAGVPVLAVTASSLSAEEDQLRARFDGYLRKPFTRAELFAALAAVLPRREGAAGPRLSAVPSGTAATPEVRRAAREALRELGGEPLRGLSRSLRMREIGVFAEHVGEHARAGGFEGLAGYARRLAQAVSAFDVTTVESLLAEFPRQLDALPAEPESNT